MSVQRVNPAELPLIIEAAISPIRRDAPAHTPDEIVAESNACLAAGAAIIHSHHDGRLDTQGAIDELKSEWSRVLAGHPGAIFYPGFVRGADIAAKTAHLVPLAEAGVLGLVPIDPGSVSMGELDDQGLPAYSNQYVNSYQDSNHVVAIAARCRLGLSVGVYEPGFLRVALAYAVAGRLPSGTQVKLYFGGDLSVYTPGKRAISYGLPPTQPSLEAYLAMLEGTNLSWSVRLSGGSLVDSPIARTVLERGGHLRVGIEDDAGASGATNEELVRAAVALAAQVGRPVASPLQARQLLAASGGSARV